MTAAAHPTRNPTRTAPTVAGTLHPPARRGQPWTVTIRCPHCTRRHIHGAGADGTTGDGHRVAHCTGRHAGIHNPGYTIRVVSADPA
jgi:hypothetical protein